MPRKDVGADIEVFRQGEVLVNGFYAAAADIGGRLVGDIDAVEDDAPLFRAVDTGDAFDQRGLARAIVAEQGDDFARVDLEIDLIDRRQAAEVLADAFCGEYRFSPL